MARLSQAAARWCQQGDRTGRSCADAELYAGEQPPPAPRLALRQAAEVMLAPGAPFPLVLAEAGPLEVGFVLDTGASESVISSRLAGALGLRVTRASFPVGVAAGGAQVHARLALLPLLRVGAAEVRHLPVLVMDLPELEQAFEGLSVTFDFARGQLALRPGPAGPSPGVTVPYYSAGLDLAVPARVGGGPTALFGLDTGMGGPCALSEEYAAALASEGQVRLSGAGAQLVAPLLSRATVHLGPTPLGEGACVRSAMAKEGIRLAGLLGNALWRTGRVTLDTVARTITVLSAPPAPAPAPGPR